MKKRVILVLIISILLISVISVSLVSASLLGDILNKITGRVTENETESTNETEAEPEPEPEQCPTIIGWRISDNICISDSGCEYDSSIYNYYNTEKECTSQLTAETEEEEEAEEEDTRSEPTPTACAVEIEINFNKAVYAIGDIIEAEVGIFDSQGNPLSNYPFYGRRYDDRWHSPDFQRTGSDGYFRFSGEAQKEPSGVTKGIFNVYTKKIGSCESVEDTTEVRLEEPDEPEPVPCGIGTCIPEEKPEKPEEIPEEKMFYKCNGCELGDRCYPMGYRKQGKYCSENYEFISQIGGKCDNDFECKSNVCISDECVGEGFMRRIIKWFKRLFGGEDEEPEPEPGDEICKKLLIEKDIEDYEYFVSEYGKHEEHQVGLFSEDGEQIGIVKCCVAGYLEDGEAKGTAGLVCPFNNRKDVENSLYWLSNKEEITLEEYKGQKVYVAGNAIIWTHKDFIIAAGTDPKATTPLPEKIINTYLDKYPNDLGEII